MMKNLLNNAVISWIRTMVPVVVGAVVVWLQPLGLNIDSTAAASVVLPVVIAVYYTAVRFLEKHWSKFGWLLGYAKQPVYAEGPVPAEPLN